MPKHGTEMEIRLPFSEGFGIWQLPLQISWTTITQLKISGAKVLNEQEEDAQIDRPESIKQKQGKAFHRTIVGVDMSLL